VNPDPVPDDHRKDREEEVSLFYPGKRSFFTFGPGTDQRNHPPPSMPPPGDLAGTGIWCEHHKLSCNR
jgi:hypothetical protein